MVTLNINRLLSCILSKEHWTTVSVLCVDLMLHTLSKVLNSVTWLSLLDRNTLRPSSYFGLWGPAWALTFCISCKKKKKKKVNIERKKVFFLSVPFLLFWSGWVLVGNMWYHVFLCTNQNLAILNKDYCWVVCSQSNLIKPQTVLIK